MGCPGAPDEAVIVPSITQIIAASIKTQKSHLCCCGAIISLASSVIMANHVIDPGGEDFVNVMLFFCRQTFLSPTASFLPTVCCFPPGPSPSLSAAASSGQITVTMDIPCGQLA
jgi:hypothetical protein